ncbi:MAG: hypothetical protein GQ531_08245 [Sulfurovum sp.]|nr:hypothetical protein [Sulfurovum sp.]
MGRSRKVKIDEYVELGGVQIAKRLLGIIIKKDKDPSADMHMAINDFIAEKKKTFNDMVENNFDLDEDFTKFEFFWVPEYAEKIDNESDCAFRMPCYITNLYLKGRSFIYFQTKYRFDVKPGCWNQGTIRAFGGNKQELEEVYFNKISSVKVNHEEETFHIVGKGCMANTITIKSDRDSLLVRAGENFKVYAVQELAKELADARKMINDKVSEVN